MQLPAFHLTEDHGIWVWLKQLNIVVVRERGKARDVLIIKQHEASSPGWARGKLQGKAFHLYYWSRQNY